MTLVLNFIGVIPLGVMIIIALVGIFVSPCAGELKKSEVFSGLLCSVILFGLPFGILGSD